jgi:hypothetical protein
LASKFVAHEWLTNKFVAHKSPKMIDKVSWHAACCRAPHNLLDTARARARGLFIGPFPY